MVYESSSLSVKVCVGWPKKKLICPSEAFFSIYRVILLALFHVMKGKKNLRTLCQWLRHIMIMDLTAHLDAWELWFACVFCPFWGSRSICLNLFFGLGLLTSNESISLISYVGLLTTQKRNVGLSRFENVCRSALVWQVQLWLNP